jgi:hypothetical protein
MKKNREPLPRSPLYQSHTAASPKSSPNLRGSVPGTPQRASSLRHQFSEDSIPHANDGFNDSPPPQGTMSVQRRNLPPYSRPLGSEDMFDEDYFQRQLKSVAPSATEAALNDIPSPLEQLGPERWEEQLDWQVARMRGGYPADHCGTGNHIELVRKLRNIAAEDLRNGKVKLMKDPPPIPVPAPALPQRLEIELPPELQGLRTRSIGARGVSSSRSRRESPMHVPHHLSMAQQQAHGLLNSSSLYSHESAQSSLHCAANTQMDPRRQFIPYNQVPPNRQLSSGNQYAIVGPFNQAQPYPVAGQITPAPHYGQARQFSPFQHGDQHSQHRHPSPASSFRPPGHRNAVRQTQAQRHSSPRRQIAPHGHMSAGSPVSRSASSYSDVMSNTSSSRYTEDVPRHSSQLMISTGPHAMMPAQSLHILRLRPMSTPYSLNPYERNNEFMIRSSYDQGAPFQRPTPPPAVGHGRPRSSEALTAPRALPHWQRNQENSEEAAMSVLQSQVERIHLNEEGRERDGEVMNNTPPHESIIERFLRED